MKVHKPTSVLPHPSTLFKTDFECKVPAQTTPESKVIFLRNKRLNSEQRSKELHQQQIAHAELISNVSNLIMIGELTIDDLHRLDKKG